MAGFSCGDKDLDDMKAEMQLNTRLMYFDLLSVTQGM